LLFSRRVSRNISLVLTFIKSKKKVTKFSFEEALKISDKKSKKRAKKEAS